jgi:uncharacterized protein YkwD
MLNRNSPNKPSTTNVINSYRKRRMQRGPFLLYGAIALVVIGIILLVIWLMGPGQPLGAMFATDTPTPTLTSTPTNTSTPTQTVTVTNTPTETLTPTPSEPFPYTIQEGDSLDAIAQKFNLGDDGILLILDQNPNIVNVNNGVIFVGETILVPPPGRTRPTSTPIPADLRRGTIIEYRVLPGDTLAGIAFRFNSLADNIITENDIEDANALQVGQILKIPVNLVTPTPTLPPTSTPVTPTVAGQPTQASTTNTPASTGSAPASCAITEKAAFVTELQTLINNARTSNNLPALSVNQKLASAAKVHTLDMLCKNYLGHTGSDGSTPQTRVTAQGYTASLVVEDIYALHPAYGITPQSAFNWWMNDPEHRADILNPNTTEFGIAYGEYEKSLLGAYFVMVSAKP